MQEPITIINGANGSGKSAISTALALLLGNRAKQTGRQNSLKEFINRKNPNQKAVISVTFSNEGPTRLEDQDDEITITRKISPQGQAPYFIKKWQGEKKKDVPISGAELKNLLENGLNIDGDNPAVLLQQTQAKSFTAVTPEERYQTFAKSARFPEIAECQNSVHTLHTKIMTELKAFEEQKTQFAENLKHATHNYEKLGQVRFGYCQPVALLFSVFLYSHQVEKIFQNVEEAKTEILACRLLEEVDKQNGTLLSLHSFAVATKMYLVYVAPAN